MTEVEVLKEKNSILMDKLFRADKQIEELKNAYESVASTSESAKDKKIIELAKKNRALSLQVETLKTKAAKAVELALKFKT